MATNNEVFLTDVQHGDEDGNVTNIKANTKVSEAKLSRDVVKQLREAGAIGEPPMTPAQRDDEMAELRDQNAELQEKLAEARKALAEAKKQESPAPPK